MLPARTVTALVDWGTTCSTLGRRAIASASATTSVVMVLPT